MNNLPLPEWLLRWLCGDRVDSIRDGEASLRLARFPEGDLGLLALLLLAAGLALIYITYSREGALARWKKYSLARSGPCCCCSSHSSPFTPSSR